MRFGLLTFSPIVGHVELGLMVCLMRYPRSRVQRGRNIVQRHLFLDCSHIFISLPFSTVTFTDYFGSFRCLWEDTCRGRGDCLLYTGHSIYIQEESIAL